MLLAGGAALLIAIWLFGFICGAHGMKIYIRQQLAKLIRDETKRLALADLDGRKKVDEVV